MESLRVLRSTRNKCVRRLISHLKFDSACEDIKTTMADSRGEIVVGAANSGTNGEPTGPSSLYTRREVLGIAGMAGLAAVTGTAFGAAQTSEQRPPRLACLVSYW